MGPNADISDAEKTPVPSSRPSQELEKDPVPNGIVDYPEGGLRAWLVVFGA
jgi:hypothetical protein